MPNSLLDRVKELFSCEYPEIQKHFDEMKPKPLYREMPWPYIGKLYEKPDYKGKRLPKVFVMAINQGRQKQEPEKVPQSLDIQVKDGKYDRCWYAPLGIAANFTRWLYAEAGDIPIDRIQPTDVHDRFAFDNYVKWAFPTRASKPPPRAWEAFRKLNKELITLLCPDIILAIGLAPYAEMTAHYGEWASDHPPWIGTLRMSANTSVAVGRVYHPSYGPRLKPRWRKFLEEEYPLPRTVTIAIDAFTGQEHKPEEIKHIVGDIDGKPWWSEEYGYWSKNYGELAKFLGWHVCGRLAKKWRQSVNNGWTSKRP